MEKKLPVSVESIKQVLHGNKINVMRIEPVIGPTVTLYKVYPERGTRASRIKVLEGDSYLSILSPSVRIVTLEDSFGIEMTNTTREEVELPVLLHSDEFQTARKAATLPIILGMNTDRTVKVADLAGLPHLLLAGATKQGKTMALHGIICSLLHLVPARNLRIVLIDPKGVELTPFEELEDSLFFDHHNKKVIVDSREALFAIQSLVKEMEVRYEILASSGCRSIKEHIGLPYIVTFIDEYGDLIGDDSNESDALLSGLLKIAQKGRAVGIHLVVSTQKLSQTIISGLIKANFPARMVFRVSSKAESRLIIDRTGAEKLTDNGDALFDTGRELSRIQTGTIIPEELDRIIKQSKSQ